MTTPRRRRAPERGIQAAGVKLLRALGARVWTLGTTRRRGDHMGTMQTPGLPDVIAFLPRGEVHPSWCLLVWEAKAPRGRATVEQREFRELCLRADVAHVLGGLDDLIAWLVAAGYARADQFAHYRTERMEER